ncbi:MAG: acid--CoA ligase [Candidatus Saccharicenans sp.]|nr:acid--CoA ligase [Candidatus Saccharicenans sp.]
MSPFFAPMVCPQYGGKMLIIAFLTDYAVVDRITNHLKLTYVADSPPPPHIAYQEPLMAAEPSEEYIS